MKSKQSFAFLHFQLVTTYEYLRIASMPPVQMMTFLSAPPEAKRFPSLAKATQYTISLCPKIDSSIKI